MPDVREGESRDSYMDRCMGDGKTVEKYGNPSQRAAVCNSMYDDKNSENAEAAEYQGKKVTLGKPFRTQGGKKKFAVYVKIQVVVLWLFALATPTWKLSVMTPSAERHSVTVTIAILQPIGLLPLLVMPTMAWWFKG